jgi:hypothetical protein
LIGSWAEDAVSLSLSHNRDADAERRLTLVDESNVTFLHVQLTAVAGARLNPPVYGGNRTTSSRPSPESGASLHYSLGVRDGAILES